MNDRERQPGVRRIAFWTVFFEVFRTLMAHQLGDVMDHVVTVLTSGLIASLAILVVIILRSTVQSRGRWRINLKRVDCPRCATAASNVRVPTTLRQALWGGWSCKACGQQFDKWGNVIPKRSQAT
jgi:hypothetical protein